jgi:hypothetical protein
MEETEKLENIICRYQYFINEGFYVIENNLILLNDPRLAKIDSKLFAYLYNKAIDGLVASIISDIWDTWNLIENSIKKFNSEPFSKDERDEFKKLDDLRCKRYFHKHQTSLSKYNYYQQLESEYPTAIAKIELAKKVGIIINNKINNLISSGYIKGSDYFTIGGAYSELNKSDIDNFVRRMSIVTPYKNE